MGGAHASGDRDYFDGRRDCRDLIGERLLVAVHRDADDSTTYRPDGSQTDVDTLACSTDFGSLTGTISATAIPALVPEPSTWVLSGSGLLALVGGRGLSGRNSLFRLS